MMLIKVSYDINKIPIWLSNDTDTILIPLSNDTDTDTDH